MSLPRRARTRSTGWLLFALICGAYLLTMSGHTYSPDEETLLATSVSLIRHGSFALDRNSTLVEVPGANGKLYSQYGPGQPVAALPIVAAGLATGALMDLPADGQGFVLRFFSGFFNALVAAALCAVFWAILNLLDCARRLAIVLTLLLAFATYLWPHSRTFFGEPLTALLLLTAFYFLLKGKAAPADRRLLLYGLFAGLALAATVAVKVQYAVALPALGVYALWVAARLGSRRLTGLFIGGLALGGGAIMLLLMLYNWSAFGSPLSTGYGADLQGTFKTPLYEGLFGLLFSSGKGLWLYAPPVFLGVIGWSAFFRRQRAEALLILGVALPTLVLFSLYRFWPGDGAWGPRYLIPLLPFVLLPAAGLGYANPLALPTVRRWLRPPRLALLVLGLSGLAVNFLGAAVNFDTYINVVNDDGTRYWYPETSPVRGHWVVLNQRLDEWRCRLELCSDGVLLLDGFSYSEGDKFLNDLFPRWTHGHVEIGLPAEAVTVTMRLADHRPPPLPRAEITLSAQGAQVISQTRVPASDEPVASVLTALLQPSGGARPTLVLDIPPWNPHEVADSPRDEQLGLMVEKMSVTDAHGKRLPIQESLAVDQMYPAPRWYYNPSSHHPLDLWAWYIYASGQQLRVGWLALLVLLPALGALFWSLPALLRLLRPRQPTADV